MRAIHIYNPDTDYALGYAGRNYSPPASIVRLRKDGALLPATFANKGDIIFVLDKFGNNEPANSQYYDLTVKKEIDIVNVNDGLESVFDGLLRQHGKGGIEILPWGWNMSLRNQLIKKGTPSWLLKSEKEIETIRSLSHRKTTIPFQTALRHLLPHLGIKVAKEFFREEDARQFADRNPGSYFKMPWSSSGRGVVCRKNMTDLKFTEWIHGAITRQGSVLGEHGYDRVLDFATEWNCRKGEVNFIGLSLFATSSNGTYIGNQSLSQQEISERIRLHSPLWSHDIINAQQKIIAQLIAPDYDGPLGIDMLADKEGNINPCVEINLRMTMGMATILKKIK